MLSRPSTWLMAAALLCSPVAMANLNTGNMPDLGFPEPDWYPIRQGRASDAAIVVNETTTLWGDIEPYSTRNVSLCKWFNTAENGGRGTCKTDISWIHAAVGLAKSVFSDAVVNYILRFHLEGACYRSTQYSDNDAAQYCAPWWWDAATNTKILTNQTCYEITQQVIDQFTGLPVLRKWGCAHKAPFGGPVDTNDTLLAPPEDGQSNFTTVGASAAPPGTFQPVGTSLPPGTPVAVPLAPVGAPVAPVAAPLAPVAVAGPVAAVAAPVTPAAAAGPAAAPAVATTTVATAPAVIEPAVAVPTAVAPALDSNASASEPTATSTATSNTTSTPATEPTATVSATPDPAPTTTSPATMPASAPASPSAGGGGGGGGGGGSGGGAGGGGAAAGGRRLQQALGNNLAEPDANGTATGSQTLTANGTTDTTISTPAPDANGTTDTATATPAPDANASVATGPTAAVAPAVVAVTPAVVATAPSAVTTAPATVPVSAPAAPVAPTAAAPVASFPTAADGPVATTAAVSQGGAITSRADFVKLFEVYNQDGLEGWPTRQQWYACQDFTEPFSEGRDTCYHEAFGKNFGLNAVVLRSMLQIMRFDIANCYGNFAINAATQGAIPNKDWCEIDTATWIATNTLPQNNITGTPQQPMSLDPTVTAPPPPPPPPPPFPPPPLVEPIQLVAVDDPFAPVTATAPGTAGGAAGAAAGGAGTASASPGESSITDADGAHRSMGVAALTVAAAAAVALLL